jgi:hypothetical protein
MLHRLCEPPSIPLSFSLATVLPRRSVYRVSLVPDRQRNKAILKQPLFIIFTPPRTNTHRLRHGLPGYLILFAPHAFAPQRQSRPRKLPSLSVFLRISSNLISPHEIPLSSILLKFIGFRNKLSQTSKNPSDLASL